MVCWFFNVITLKELINNIAALILMSYVMIIFYGNDFITKLCIRYINYDKLFMIRGI